jgi:hypothetical protein
MRLNYLVIAKDAEAVKEWIILNNINSHNVLWGNYTNMQYIDLDDYVVRFTGDYWNCEEFAKIAPMLSHWGFRFNIGDKDD